MELLPGVADARHRCRRSDLADIAQNAVVCELVIAEYAERLLVRASLSVSMVCEAEQARRYS